MAERTVKVCDECGATPADTARITVKGKNSEKDYCAIHLTELLRSSRPPKRGRPAQTSSR